MDALGFAFENFDAIGGFRNGMPMAPLILRARFRWQNLPGRRGISAGYPGQKDLVARNVAEKLMTWKLAGDSNTGDERAPRNSRRSGPIGVPIPRWWCPSRKATRSGCGGFGIRNGRGSGPEGGDAEGRLLKGPDPADRISETKVRARSIP